MLKAVHTPKSELTTSVPPPKRRVPTAMAVGSFLPRLTSRVLVSFCGGALQATIREP
jgi:hypothetical protein